MERLEVGKTQELDGISNWVLKVCNSQLTDKIHFIVECSLKEGNGPKNWKKIDIVLIFKECCKRKPL